MAGKSHPPGSKMLWWNAMEGLGWDYGARGKVQGLLNANQGGLWCTRTTAALPSHQETMLKP